MIAITTKSSISVKPHQRRGDRNIWTPPHTSNEAMVRQPGIVIDGYGAVK
jgi:hypothetical protein